MHIIYMWFVLLPFRFSHDSPYTLGNIRLRTGQDDRIEGWNIETFMGLTESRKDDLLLGRFLKCCLFHTTHVQSRCLGKTLMKKFTMLTTVTEDKELSRTS